MNLEGLKLKPTFEHLIDDIYEAPKIKYPDRRAKFIRDGFVLSQLDERIYEQMEKQQLNQAQYQIIGDEFMIRSTIHAKGPSIVLARQAL